MAGFIPFEITDIDEPDEYGVQRLGTYPVIFLDSDNLCVLIRNDDGMGTWIDIDHCKIVPLKKE